MERLRLLLAGVGRESEPLKCIVFIRHVLLDAPVRPGNRLWRALDNVLAGTEVKTQSPIRTGWSSPRQPVKSVSIAAKPENAGSL